MYANVRNMISSSPWVRYAQMTVRTSHPCEILLSRNQRKVVPTSRQPWQPKSCYTIRNNGGGIAMMNEGIVGLRLCTIFVYRQREWRIPRRNYETNIYRSRCLKFNQLSKSLDKNLVLQCKILSRRCIFEKFFTRPENQIYIRSTEICISLIFFIK